MRRIQLPDMEYQPLAPKLAREQSVRMPEQQLAPLPGIQPPQSQRVFRGVNRLDDFSIGDEYASDMANLTTAAFPALTVRPGYTVLGSAIGSKVLGLGVWKNTEIHAVFNDGTWRRWNGSAWSTLVSGLNASARWTFTNYQGNLAGINLIGSNGVDAIRRYDGSTVQTLANAPSGGNYICSYQNRLWCAVGNTLHACALDQPDKWTLFNGDDADSYFVEIESPTGETVSSLQGGLQKLTIGMPHAVQLLYGGVPSEFTVRPVTFDTGIVAAETHDGTLITVDDDGIYQFGGGTQPDRDFSAVVQDYADQVNKTGLPGATVGADGQRIYVALPVGGTTPDTVLMFDPRKDVQAWNVWKNVAPTCWAKMGDDFYCGDASGRVLRWGGTTDAGAPINWHWDSRLLTSRLMAQRLRMYRLWVTADLPAGSSLTVYLSKTEAGTDWTAVKSLTATGDLHGERMEVPVTTAAQASWIRVRLAGSGPATVREIVWHNREMLVV